MSKKATCILIGALLAALLVIVIVATLLFPGGSIEEMIAAEKEKLAYKEVENRFIEQQLKELARPTQHADGELRIGQFVNMSITSKGFSVHRAPYRNPIDYFAVEVLVENGSSETLDFGSRHYTLKDGDGYEYEIDYGLQSDLRRALDTSINLAPGEKVRGLVGFPDVPRSATDISVSFEYGDTIYAIWELNDP